jgi:hypothetical protein
MHGQCLGKAIQDIDRRVFFSPLEPTNVGPINPGVEGESLLGEASPHPNSPQVPGHQRSPIHDLRRTACGVLNHWLYPVCYDVITRPFRRCR